MEEVASEVAPTSSDVPMAEAPQDASESEPKPKKRKVSEGERDAHEKLEHRLGGILRCAVCLDLPRAAVYQVSTKTADFTITINRTISCF